jgi:hypothetical protein
MDLSALRKGWLPAVRGVIVAGLAFGAVFGVACSDDDGENDANPPSLPAATAPGGNAVSTSTAAGGGAGTATSGSTAPTVQLTARDFAYDINDSIVGGLVKLEMRNTGQEPHHAQFGRLNDGVTQQQFTAALMNPDPGAALGMISLAGGPGIVQPGQSQVVYDDLRPGKYTLLCFVEGSDGVPHAAKGMIDFIDVTAPTGTASTPPTAQLQMSVADFSFTGGDTIPASRTTVEVTNNGPQPHEVAILKLDSGVTVEQLRAMFAATTPPAGPPPFEESGGLQAIGRGQKGWMELNLAAGNYAYICFVPDPATGSPHFALGMLKGFTVR